MRTFIYIFLGLVITLPILLVCLVFGFSSYKNFERNKTIDYIESEIKKFDDVTIHDLRDMNEEFPFCCTEVSVSLLIDGNTLEIGQLDRDSFNKDYSSGVNLHKLNGKWLTCGETPYSRFSGFDLNRLPDENLWALNIQNINDLIYKYKDVIDVLSNWPDTYENGIYSSDFYPGKTVRCYLGAPF